MIASNTIESMNALGAGGKDTSSQKPRSSSTTSETLAHIADAKSNLLRRRCNTSRMYSIYRGAIMIQSLLFTMAAAFLIGCPIYENSNLKAVFRALSINIQVGEVFYTVFYFISGAVVAACSIFHFVPNAWILTNIPTWVSNSGQEAFTLARTLLTFPAIRFYFSITDCLPIPDSPTYVEVVGGKYTRLVCRGALQTSMKVFACIVVLLLIFAILHTIELRYSIIDRVKITKFTILDERAKIYHQYAFMQTVVFSLATVPYTGVAGEILSCIIFSLTTTSLFLHLLLDPYHDLRMLTFVAGGLSASTYTSFICFLTWYYPYSFTLYMFFMFVPLAFICGCVLEIFKRKAWLYVQFMEKSPFHRIPPNLRIKWGKFMSFLLNERPRQKGDFSNSFRGASHLFLTSFTSLLKTNTSLEKLILSHNFLKEVHMLALLQALMYHPMLSFLDLSNNEIQFSDKSCVNTMRVFFRCTQLKNLNLTGNPLGNQGLKYLSEALTTSGNLHLNHLTLSRCELTSSCRISIAQLMGPSIHLTSLNLSCNALGYNTLVAMSRVLKGNETLKSLDLSWNRFDLRGVNDLKEAVMENRTLQELKLGSNGIPAEVIHSIQEILRANLSEKSSTKLLSDEQIVRELGGPDVLNKIVEMFYIKVFKDPQLNPRFLNLKMDRMRFLMFDYLHAFFTGTMETYPGKSLRRGHSHLKITDMEFDGIHMHLMNTIGEICPALSNSIKKHISNALESFRTQIVTKYVPPIVASISTLPRQAHSMSITSKSSASTGFFSCHENLEVENDTLKRSKIKSEPLLENNTSNPNVTLI